jgi:CubicO group peptidase (beta-lactamase class C family)
MVRTLCFGLSALVAHSAFPDGLQEALQTLAVEKSQQYNCAVSIAVHDGKDTLAAAAGSVDPGDEDSRVTLAADKFAWGSGTKPLTGASILRLVEQQRFSLDDPVAPLVNPLLLRMAAADPSQGFKSLADLWGDAVNTITVRDLATMQSPIPDFDTASGKAGDDILRAQLYEVPEKAWSPTELMALPWVSNLSSRSGGYSSTNFMLLGLVLAAQADAESWDVFDQSSVLPESLRAHVGFADAGGPKDFTEVHGRDRTSYNMPENETNDQDVSAVSGVFAGWTASNLVATPSAVAELFWDIYGPEPSVANSSSSVMANPAKSGLGMGSYGFATFQLSSRTGLETTSTYGQAWGHLGATYGYQSIAVWLPGLQLALAVATNIETDHQSQPADVFCFAYNAVATRMLGRESECSFVDAGYHGGGCSCTELTEPVVSI